MTELENAPMFHLKRCTVLFKIYFILVTYVSSTVLAFAGFFEDGHFNLPNVNFLAIVKLHTRLQVLKRQSFSRRPKR